MDDSQSRTIALALLQAKSSKDVNEIFEQHQSLFNKAGNWAPYGGRRKNWDTIGNQQSSGAGAFTELIVNSQDSVLTRKAYEDGLTDLRSKEAPQSMFEAVGRFYPHVVEGRLQNLSERQLTDLAEETILVRIDRARKGTRYPTYSIIDRGEGQAPSNFRRTFLSLGENNKDGVAFVQGKFNMGSTGSLSFCTKSERANGHYKLIVSKRYDDSSPWGWTLVRVRGPYDDEALPVAEYFAPDGSVPAFTCAELDVLDGTGVAKLTTGTVIRLYEYEIGTPFHTVDFGLYRSLMTNLIDCALPIRIFDYGAQPKDGRGPLRAAGIAARNFAGLSWQLRSDLRAGDDEDPEVPEEANEDASTEFVHLVKEDAENADLGIVRVIAIGMSQMSGELRERPERIFYTVNGQRQAIERASFFNTRVGLGDLRNHVLVNVLCDRMTNNALTDIFMPDRERKRNTTRARALEGIVISALKDDAKLKRYVKILRKRRASKHVEDDEKTRDLMRELIRSDPSIRQLLGLGNMVLDTEQKTNGDNPYEGKRFPTFLNPLNLRPAAVGTGWQKELPIGSKRRIDCGTDASNDYLSRAKDPGQSYCSKPSVSVPHSISLRNGTASYTLTAPHEAKPGDTNIVTFGFKDNGPNVGGLLFGVEILYTKPETPKKAKRGKPRETKQTDNLSKAHPSFQWVEEGHAGEHGFNEDSGGYVQSSEDQTDVFVYRGNRFLKQMLANEANDADRLIVEHRFLYGLGFLTLALHKRADENAGGTETEFNDPEEFARAASSAISPYIVSVIKRLGESELHD